MPSSVDNRVVAMKFDNQQFERNISESISSLNKLNDASSFEGAGAGLDALSRSADGFSLDGIGNAVDNINKKFSVLGAVAFGAINQIVGAAVDAGKKIYSTFADPILTGGKERAQNIEQAKFQFRGLGIDVEAAMKSSLDAVKGTAYGLDSAAKAAAQLGASGIKTGAGMTSILRGIAGTAAMTGTSFDEMAQIFTSSAALGKVSNQDLDQFATRGLNAAAALAKQLGTTEANVRTMAKDGKLDFKTFSDAMDKAFGEHATQANETYAGSLANMHAAMSRLGASFFALHDEKMRDIFNALTPVIDNVTAALAPLINTVNFFFGLFSGNLVEKLKVLDFSKFNFAIQIFSDALAHLIVIVDVFRKLIGKAFKDVFPAGFGDLVVKIAVGFHQLVDALKPNDLKTLDSIHKIFRGIFDAAAIVIEIVKQVFRVFKTLFSSFESANGGKLLAFFTGVAEKVTELKLALVNGGGIEKLFTKWIQPVAEFIGHLDIFGAIGKVIDVIKKVAAAIGDLFGKGGSDIADGASKFSAGGDQITGFFKKIGGAFQGFLNFMKPIVKAISDIFSNIFDKISEVFSSGTTGGILKAINTGLFATIVLTIRKWIKDGAVLNFDIGKGLFAGIKETFGALTDTLGAMQAQLKAEALQKIAIAIAILVASILVLSFIDPSKVAASLAAIATGFGELAVTMSVLNKIADDNKDAAKLGILAIDLILLAGAILVLAVACKVLASIDGRGLVDSTVAIGILLTEIVAFLKAMPDGKKLLATSVGLIAIGTGIFILSLAMRILGTMNGDEIAQGAAAIAAALATIVVALDHMPPGRKTIALAGSLLVIAFALNIMALAILTFGIIDFSNEGKGLIAMTATLGILALALKLMPDGPGLLLVGIGLKLVAGAMQTVANVVKDFGGTDLKTMVTGITELAAVMLILVVAVNAMNGAAAGAGTMILVSGAIIILAKSLEIMAAVGIGNIIIAMIGVALALGVIAGAAILMAPILPLVVGLGAALEEFGIGALAFGAAVFLIAAAFYVLIAAIEKMAEIGGKGLDGIVKFVDGFIKLIPKFVQAIVEFALGIVFGFLDGLPEIITQLNALVSAVLDFLITNIPKFGEAITVLIQTILTTLVANFPSLMLVGFMLLNSLLQGIDDNIASITDSAVNIVVTFLDTLASRAGDFTTAASNLIIAILLGIAANAQGVVDAGFQIVEQIMLGIGKNILQLTSYATGIIVAIITGIDNDLWKIINAGGDLIIHFITGLASKSVEVANAAGDALVDFLNGIATAIKTHSHEINDAGFNIMSAIIDGMADGIGRLGGKVEEVAKELANKLPDWVKYVLGIHSPSKVFHAIGQNVVKGLINGLNDNEGAVTAAKNFGNDVIDGVNDTFDQIVFAIQNMDEFNPTITPVLDLSNVETGAKRLNGLVGDPSLAVGTSFGAASSIAFASRKNSQNGSDSGATKEPQVVKFEQNNYSPDPLNAAAVYRNTRSQLTLAKEELAK